jgi:hypothetical protein
MYTLGEIHTFQINEWNVNYHVALIKGGDAHPFSIGQPGARHSSRRIRFLPLRDLRPEKTENPECKSMCEIRGGFSRHST